MNAAIFIPDYILCQWLVMYADASQIIKSMINIFSRSLNSQHQHAFFIGAVLIALIAVTVGHTRRV